MYNDTKGAPQVLWKKGGMLRIPQETEGYSNLTFEEIGICSTLRILPLQYLHIKETILGNVLKLKGPFKKRDAKSWFRIDVNKVNFIGKCRRPLSSTGSKRLVGSRQMKSGR
jgi:hypothetical protein